jgi:hypothetical protein
MLDETAARWLLVLHTALGVAAVAAGTHLVIWLRRYVRGQAGKRRAVIKFAWIFVALQLAAFVAGNVMYPTYKVEVRSAYLENAPAIAAERAARADAEAKVASREHAAPSEGTATTDLVRRMAKAARWFDVKEHWIALGILASLAVVLMLSLWDPDRDGRVLAPIVTTLAVVASGTTWLGAIIGVLTAAWRAV